jgi:hypothetical protein
MTKLIAALSTAALALSLAGPAAAQVAGTYTGTSADGSGLTFVVATDPNTGALAVTSAIVFYSAPCKGSTTVLDTGWGYGLTADVTSRAVTNDTSGSYFDINFSLKFAPDGQSATGTIASISPDLDPSTTPPTKALFCESKKQKLTLTLQPASGAHITPPGVAPGVAYEYDRKGRIIGQIAR